MSIFSLPGLPDELEAKRYDEVGVFFVLNHRAGCLLAIEHHHLRILRE